MGNLAMHEPTGPKIESSTQMAAMFLARTIERAAAWQARLQQSPHELETIEREVQAQFMLGAGMFVSGLLAVVLAMPELAEASEQMRRNFQQPLSPGRNRTVKVSLLGGFVMWVTSLYCQPVRGKTPAETAAVGLHVELAQFGFGKGITPGLQSRVARQAALCPSLQLACDELKRDGLSLNVKAVRRIANQCGENLLQLRKTRLLQWRTGTLPAGTELTGQRVSVQIDGGRTKLRERLQAAKHGAEPLNEEGLVIENQPGRSKRRARRTFAAEWREPKLLRIYVHDELGRMVKKSQAVIDGTFLGPDAIAELTAMHLHRLGAAKAKSITFVGDGAIWIWERVEQIIAQANIPSTVTIHQVLDNCHASHHIALALATLGLTEQERMPLYRELRTQLRNGGWREVISQLEDLLASYPECSGMATEIAYLRKHGEAGRLNYAEFKTLGIPLGSGAIESSIRRVINLRLKSNGTFWLKEHAESMLQLRALVMSNRWDENLRAMRAMNREQSQPDWTWTPRCMKKVEAPSQACLNP